MRIWQVAYGLGSVNINAGDDQVVKAVTQAISLGYHHLDCAEGLCHNSSVIVFIRQAY